MAELGFKPQGAQTEEQKRAALLASQPAAVQQIPTTGAPKAPAPDGSMNDPLNNEVGRNLTALSAAVPGGLAAKSALQSAGRLGTAIAGADKVRGFSAAVAPYAVPAAGLAGLAAASSPAASPALPGGANPAPTLAAAPAQTAAPGTPGTATEMPATSAPANANQITATRQANGVMSFSGGPNIGKDGGAISYTGASGFKPSGAGVTTVPASGVVSASSFGDASVSAARAAAADRGDFQAVSDSYGGKFAGGQYGAPAGMQTAAQRLLAQTAGRRLNANGVRALVDAQNSDNSAAQQKNAAGFAGQKLNLDQQELGLKKDDAAIRARAAVQMEQAQAAFQNAKTPEAKAAAEANLRALQGSFGREPQPNRFTVVPGGQEFDQQAGTAVTRPARVFNNQTGQFVDQVPAGPTGPVRVTTQAEYDKLPPGTTYIGKDGNPFIKPQK